MKYLFIIAFTLLFCWQSGAQIGFSVSYGQTDDPTLQSFLIQLDPQFQSDTEPILGFSPRYSIDYWHRLKNKRIEFFPELSYISFKNNIRTEQVSNSMEVALYGFQYNTNFYLLDFNGDCDCPTFSKQGPSFQKGFFVQLAPGINGMNKKLSNETTSFTDFELLFSISGGIGFDIGVSDLITISPFAKATWYFQPDWESFSSFLFPTTNFEYPTDDQLHQIVAGIRIGIRWNQ